MWSYTLDTLTDGSENTGGGGTVFLSVWKTRSLVAASSHNNGSATVDDDDDQQQDVSSSSLFAVDGSTEEVPEALCARYAITGVGDTLSRLAADQRYKLARVKAVFDTAVAASEARPSPSSSTARSTSSLAAAGLWGLPSLCMALHRAGAPDLAVVTTTPCSRVEQIIRLLDSHRHNPVIHLCQVPAPSSMPTSSSSCSSIADSNNNNANVSMKNGANRIDDHTNGEKDETSTEDESSSSSTWWKVYEDEYIVVHTRSYVEKSGRHSGVVSLYTLLPPPGGAAASATSNTTTATHRTKRNSFLVIPPHVPISVAREWDLPILTLHYSSNNHSSSSSYRVPIHCFAGIALGHDGVGLDTTKPTKTLLSSLPSSSVSSDDEEESQQDGDNGLIWFYTNPRHDVMDPNILVRARRQSEFFHQRAPRCFPWRTQTITNTKNCSKQQPSLPLSASTSIEDDTYMRLRSGTSAVLDPLIMAVRRNSRTKTKDKQQNNRPIVVDRIRCDRNDVVVARPQLGGQRTKEQRFTATWFDRMQRFCWQERHQSGSLPLGQTTMTTKTSTSSDCNEIALDDDDDIANDDENEISLDDDEEEEGNAVDKELPSSTIDGADSLADSVRLLVLGTGCASPSPHRGASGYALLFSQFVIAFEAGEGYVTNWHRHCCQRRLDDVRIVWISHAHWDHYGGLVPLLTAINQQKNDAQDAHNCSERPSKRTRVGEDRQQPLHDYVPWVVAPPKVLRYLELMFDHPHNFYRGIRHDDSVSMSHMATSLAAWNSEGSGTERPGSFHPTFWQNVLVDHCSHAYGFVMEISKTRSRPDTTAPTAHAAPFIFCFSGDTVPCMRLVRACHDLSNRYGWQGDRNRLGVDFLLHEATFDENERQMSLMKRHSTIRDAVDVAGRMGARKVLLTHFSQRYTDVLTAGEADHDDGIAFAYDGMLVKLC